MRKHSSVLFTLLTLLAFMMLTNCNTPERLSFQVTYQLPALADMPVNLGVAGTFSGILGNKLVIAGGANFPDNVPWRGGHKTWWKTGYILDLTTRQWSVEAELLAFPLGYGVSVQLPDGILCVGGSSKDGCSSDVFALKLRDDKIYTDTVYPSLPVPLANATGCMLNGKVYIAGGQTSMQQEEATSSFYMLDLNQPDLKWEELNTWPGPTRGYAVSVAFHDKFYLFSGRSYAPGVAVNILTDGYVYDPATGAWDALSGEFPVMAGTAFSDQHAIYLVGGSTQMLPGSDSHPGFSNVIRMCDPSKSKITILGQHTPIPVTTTLVVHKNHVYITSGEIKPGIRTPDILKATF